MVNILLYDFHENRNIIHISGLRARMGAGNSMMNDLTIIQATQVRAYDNIFAGEF